MLHIEEGRRFDDREGDEEDVGVYVGEGPGLGVVLLARGVPQGHVEGLPRDLGVVHHLHRGVEHCRPVGHLGKLALGGGSQVNQASQPSQRCPAGKSCRTGCRL